MRNHSPMTALLALLLVTGGVPAQQKYPTKPIRLIVPREMLRSDVVKWQKVVKIANIKAGS